MGVEIERKFLVRSDAWHPGPSGTRMRQGYLTEERGCTVRVRVAGDRAFLTLKGEARGFSRSEYEYSIPSGDAEEMLAELRKGGLVDKTRYLRPHAGHVFEVDEFHGANEGLVVAEVELESEAEKVDLPDWIGDEVTGDGRYSNASLARRPFSTW